jgi:uncharacterized protein YprB with RNaseH-like and TPR domain
MVPLAAGHPAFGLFGGRKQRGERRWTEEKNQERADELAKQAHVSRQAYYDTLAKKRRMSHFQHRLRELRDQIARIDRKYADPPRPAAFRYIEEWLTGEEVETAFGRHFETEKRYESHRRHGSADIGALADLPVDLLDELSGGAISRVPPEEWAFLDTETTGLAGGAGTCAFLIGIGYIARDGFRVRQFFMRGYPEEASLLDAVARRLAQFRVLITYNGRAYDQPLLEARYRWRRARSPFAALKHLDLLYGARRLWKLRFEHCRLVDLENRILGVERQGDLPGALIPYVYFEYLRTRLAAHLLPVFQHNATDILSLACLTAIVPHAFRDPGGLPLLHGAEMAGIAAWLKEAGEMVRARDLFRRAVDAGLADELLFRVLWDLAAIERRLGNEDGAVQVWTDLSGSPNPFRVRALEELAKHHEHRLKDRTRALEFTQAARALSDSPGLEQREARLAKCAKAAEKKRSAAPAGRPAAPLR